MIIIIIIIFVITIYYIFSGKYNEMPVPHLQVSMPPIRQMALVPIKVSPYSKSCEFLPFRIVLLED